MEPESLTCEIIQSLAPSYHRSCNTHILKLLNVDWFLKFSARSKVALHRTSHNNNFSTQECVEESEAQMSETASLP